jgi:hypothetical protein
MFDLGRAIDALLPQAKGKPAAMMHLARLMRRDGQHQRALVACRQALALAPDDPDLAAQARAVLGAGVPSWHFSIVRDAARNAAYDAALRRAVRPGTRVLEIGTGTGLLAMMAARAGAAEIITCERDPIIAEIAQEIIARNGFADRVRVVVKHSDALDVAADLRGPVDLLISEIISNDLLAGDVLPVHERAVRALLKPGGGVIPASGLIRAALAEDLRDETAGLGVIDGFDLSPFNNLAPPSWKIRVDHPSLQLRGEAVDLFGFDFASGRYCAEARVSMPLQSFGGRVTGIAQWILLQMDDSGSYENTPAPDAQSCWAVLVYPFPRPIETAPGQRVGISASHDRHHIMIWLDDTHLDGS